MPSTAADAAETMFRHALEEAGFPDQASSPAVCKGLLLYAANRFRDRSIANVEKAYKAKRKPVRWHVASNRFILDKLFAIDSLIHPGGGVDKQFAFDVTLDPQKVTKKMNSHRNLFPIWDEAGLRIQKSAVILLVPGEEWGNEWGWGLLTASQREDLIDRVTDIIYSMDEQSAGVTEYIINF